MAIARHYMMHAAPGQEKALEAILLTLAEMAGGMGGCQGVQLLRDKGNAGRFVLVEKWESVDAHTAAVAGFSREIGKSLRATLAHPLEGAYFDYLRD
jgi:heme oxygenase (mycobilin-producing)